METNSKLRVALVTESLWGMGGANRTLEVFAKAYPQADIYALFGSPRLLSKVLQKHKIYFSKLNNRPFISTLYRYTYHLWPLNMERFNFSDYDLVISSSASVAMGIVVPTTCKHIAYIHSPMRYLWDLKSMGKGAFKGIKGSIRDFLLTFLRIWEVNACNRPDVVIVNSKFVAKRIKKYWGRTPDYVLTPPVNLYKGNIVKKRKKYIVAGAPFEFNKKGDFLLDCISNTDIHLKIIGTGSMFPRLRRKYMRYRNIEFLGKINDEDKWNILSNASCFVMPGIEDYGIFPVEAMSAGCPVLAYKEGGIMENLKEGINGVYFTKWNREEFLKKLDKVLNVDWNYIDISNSIRKNNNSEEDFIMKFINMIS